MSKYKLVPMEPTPAMVQAAEDAYMPFGDMELAIQMAILEAPEVDQEPVAWQFFQDGKWWNGGDRIKDHRKNTEAAGYPVRDLYAHPQPALNLATQCARCDQGTEPKMCGDFAIHPTSYDGIPHPQDICNWCGHTRECHARRTAQNVKGLIEALARCRQQASYTTGSIEALQNQLHKIRDIANEAIATYRKGGE